MILYHPRLATELARFGIDLPLRDDRSDQVFALLKEQFPSLSPFSLESLISISREDIARVHDESFLENWFSEKGFLEETLKAYDCQKNLSTQEAPLEELRESILRQVSATYTSLEMALDSGFCFYLGGGMHHARRSFGSGFCPLNDIVIAIRKAQASGAIRKALVIDIDAHHGDGTAEVTLRDHSITTLSIHMAKGWPFDSELPLVSSDIDLPIEIGQEATYLKRLGDALSSIENCDFDCVVVVAGADPHERDELKSSEGLLLTKEQMLARDMLVYKWCRDQKIPQLWLMAGGYGKEAPSIYAQFILKILHLMG
ncbi:MAG: histone deacetylase [Bacteriovoracaceae bacterium]|nr:histone deacetylase [Bacteriovoracaceae bacterium]